MAKELIQFPPVKVGVMIDGGFFIKRFNALYNRDKKLSGSQVAHCLYTLAHMHVGNRNTLYRIFYYDCYPFNKKFQHPLTNKTIDFSKTPQYNFRMELIETLKRKRKLALRMGTLKDNKNWLIRPQKVKDLLSNNILIEDLAEDDVYLDLKQKGIDMKIAVDIASLAFNRFVDTIVLFSGDSDFVPASKLARRQGIDFILDPMQAYIEPQLFEHIDGVQDKSKMFRLSPKYRK